MTNSAVCYGGCRFSQGDLGTDKRFTGQRLDNTGLYYYGARYYDPTIGRFISADTIVPDPSNPQTLNRYTYCLNNPLSLIDPSGHWSIGNFLKGVGDTFIASLQSSCMPYQLYESVRQIQSLCTDTTSFTEELNYAVNNPTEYCKEFYGGRFNEFTSYFDVTDERGQGHVTGVVAQILITWKLVPSGGNSIKTSSVMNSRKLGIAGEETVEDMFGLVKNTKRIESLTGSAKYRVPDILNNELGVIGEVKNVQSLSYTNQLKDFSMWAQRNSYTFNLYVRQSTVISSSDLIEAISHGDITLWRCLP